MHVIIISLNPVQSSSSNSTLLFTSISVCIGFFLLLLFFCYSHLLVVIVYIYSDASYLSDEISIYSSLSFVLKKGHVGFYLNLNATLLGHSNLTPLIYRLLLWCWLPSKRPCTQPTHSSYVCNDLNIIL